MAASSGAGRMIDIDTFCSGDMLSFTDQPYLAELFASVSDASDEDLTVVVGAGVSMDAGFISWPELIDLMTKQIKNEKLAQLVRDDKIDLPRKGELVLQLIKNEKKYAKDAQIIRAALYLNGGSTHRNTGQLARSIARFICAHKGKARLITTNFDTLLENALCEYFDPAEIKPFGLRGLDPWTKWLKQSKIGVLHVHGLVPPPYSGRRRLDHIVLAESQFLRHGAKVREVIFENLKDRVSIFAGLSMSDPNLIGPLYELKQLIENQKKAGEPIEGGQRFALMVPGGAPNTDDNRYRARYSIEAAGFLDRELGLKTIFLRSYSQLNQVLADLTLASVAPKKYQPGAPGIKSSLVYENRLKSALGEVYTNIGCTAPKQEVPIAEKARELHDALYDAMQRGPVSKLIEFADAMSADHDINKPDGENFGMFLWLRCQEAADQEVNYAIQMVGSSTYTHREQWSLPKRQDIVKDSQMTAVRAVFYGKPIVTNLDPAPSGLQTWRGIIACPLILPATKIRHRVKGFPADILTVGAVTFNSTYYVDKKDESTMKDSADPKPLSIIASLDVTQTSQISATLVEIASAIITREA
ncbi:SIR2 family protein [Amycolatopsis sp. WAC 01376]|uniref:SIR2 family protein n=1 Tax=Amycolatopsis sp. WAC 01376 TaxID=2203195 RepID=UPI0013157ECC|nr:SIR2 family protein [Amycolatopsis sp. WAC 01376]